MATPITVHKNGLNVNGEINIRPIGTPPEGMPAEVNVYNDIGTLMQGRMYPLTYNYLVSLKNSSQLMPGTFYKITDYQAMTKFVETTKDSHCELSSGHYGLVPRSGNQDNSYYAFDIIVLATSKNTISRRAWAAQHEGRTYYQHNNLAAWELEYTLDQVGAANTVSGISGDTAMKCSLRVQTGYGAFYSWKDVVCELVNDGEPSVCSWGSGSTSNVYLWKIKSAVKNATDTITNWTNMTPDWNASTNNWFRGIYRYQYGSGTLLIQQIRPYFTQEELQQQPSLLTQWESGLIVFPDGLYIATESKNPTVGSRVFIVSTWGNAASTQSTRFGTCRAVCSANQFYDQDMQVVNYGKESFYASDPTNVKRDEVTGAIIPVYNELTWSDSLKVTEAITEKVTFPKRGTVLRLKDEFGNEAPYDFKGLVYGRWKKTTNTSTGAVTVSTTRFSGLPCALFATDPYISGDYWSDDPTVGANSASAKICNNKVIWDYDAQDPDPTRFMPLVGFTGSDTHNNTVSGMCGLVFKSSSHNTCITTTTLKASHGTRLDFYAPDYEHLSVYNNGNNLPSGVSMLDDYYASATIAGDIVNSSFNTITCDEMGVGYLISVNGSRSNTIKLSDYEWGYTTYTGNSAGYVLPGLQLNNAHENTITLGMPPDGEDSYTPSSHDDFSQATAYRVVTIIRDSIENTVYKSFCRIENGSNGNSLLMCPGIHLDNSSRNRIGFTLGNLISTSHDNTIGMSPRNASMFSTRSSTIVDTTFSEASGTIPTSGGYGRVVLNNSRGNTIGVHSTVQMQNALNNVVGKFCRGIILCAGGSSGLRTIGETSGTAGYAYWSTGCYTYTSSSIGTSDNLDCIGNTVGDGCEFVKIVGSDNVIGNDCGGRLIDSSTASNTFIIGHCNRLGDGCYRLSVIGYYNTYGTGCHDIIINIDGTNTSSGKWNTYTGNGRYARGHLDQQCHHNTWGNNCHHIYLGLHNRYLTYGNNCHHIIITKSGGSTLQSYVENVGFGTGVSNQNRVCGSSFTTGYDSKSNIIYAHNMFVDRPMNGSMDSTGYSQYTWTSNNGSTNAYNSTAGVN